MLLAGWEILQDVFERFSGGVAPKLTVESLVLLLLTLPLNMFIVSYEGRRGRELGSDVLVADATGTRVNIFVSLSALVGLIGSQFSLPWLDVVVAVGIVVYVVRTAGRILRETSDVLTDSVVADPHLVEDVARGVPGVWNASQVRSRGRDLGAVVVRNAVAPNLRALAVDAGSKIANLVVQVIEGFETMQPVFLSNTSAFSLSTPRPFYFLLPRHHAEEGKMP